MSKNNMHIILNICYQNFCAEADFRLISSCRSAENLFQHKNLAIFGRRLAEEGPRGNPGEPWGALGGPRLGGSPGGSPGGEPLGGAQVWPWGELWDALGCPGVSDILF